LNRLTPRATAILLVAANVPDLDVVSAAGGSLAYLRYHRHLTHAIVMAPVMAALSVVLVRFLGRRPVAWKRAWLIAMVGVASHLALDYTNVYGIRLLLPFSERWLRLDITSVWDPWIWVMLLLAVVPTAISRLVAAEIGASTRAGSGAAICALGLILFYEGGRAVLHARAVAMLDQRLYGAASPARVAAFPSPYNPFRWQGLVDLGRSYRLFDFNVREDFDPDAGSVIRQAEDSAALRSAADAPEFRYFRSFAHYPLWSTVPLSDPPNAVLVQLSDMRFGASSTSGFTATAIVDERQRLLSSWFSFLGRR
jgi:inner membrane protein